MVAVLQRRISPDEAWFGVAARTPSHLLVVCGGCNIAFRAWKWPIKVGADSTEGHCIKAMRSFLMTNVLKVCLSPESVELWWPPALRNYRCFVLYDVVKVLSLFTSMVFFFIFIKYFTVGIMFCNWLFCMRRCLLSTRYLMLTFSCDRSIQVVFPFSSIHFLCLPMCSK